MIRRPGVMRRRIRYLIAVVAGLALGSVVNLARVWIGPRMIAPPADVDLSSAEGHRATIHLLEPRHFLFPFLAHALGTLAGVWIAGRVAPRRSPVPGLVVGAAFLAGGIAAARLIPAPAWFIALDLVAAYLPMAAVGAWLARRPGAPAPPAAAA